LLGADPGGLGRIGPHEVTAALKAFEETHHQAAVLLGPAAINIDAGELPIGHEIQGRAKIAETSVLRLVAVRDRLQTSVDLARLEQPPARRRAADDRELVVR